MHFILIIQVLPNLDIYSKHYKMFGIIQSIKLILFYKFLIEMSF